MKKMDFLPLGSIVLLEGGIQKLMIVARGLNVKYDGDEYFFDYGAVMFPQGLMGDQLTYFNHSGISRVVSYGYMDDETAVMDETLSRYVAEHPDLKRLSPDQWNADLNRTGVKQ